MTAIFHIIIPSRLAEATWKCQRCLAVISGTMHVCGMTVSFGTLARCTFPSKGSLLHDSRLCQADHFPSYRFRVFLFMSRSLAFLYHLCPSVEVPITSSAFSALPRSFSSHFLVPIPGTYHVKYHTYRPLVTTTTLCKPASRNRIYDPTQIFLYGDFGRNMEPFSTRTSSHAARRLGDSSS